MKATNSYKPEIDGLRAFAVFCVIINHFSKDFCLAAFWELIFFVLSGYLIISSLKRNEKKNPLINFLNFLKRIFRIYPLLIFYVFLVSFFICLFNPSPGGSLMTGLTSLFGLSNYYLYKESFEYFSNSILLNPFVHTWSLSLELQFYLILNLIFLSTKFKTNLKDFALIIILISFVIASILIYFLNHEINFLSTYYLMPSRFWEFGIGCLISLIPLDNILF